MTPRARPSRTHVAHAEAAKATEKAVVVTHLSCLGPALNSPVFQSEVLQNLDEACKVACVAFDVEANQVVPQKRSQERIVQETIDVLVLHVVEETVEAVKYIPQNGVQDGTVERIIHGLVPQMRKETGEVTQLIAKERISRCIIVPAPQIRVEAVKHVPQERVQSNTLEQIGAVAVPGTREETGRVIQLTPQDRISDRVVEHVVHVSVREIPEHTVDVVKVIPQERLQQRTQAKDPAVQVAQMQSTIRLWRLHKATDGIYYICLERRPGAPKWVPGWCGRWRGIFLRVGWGGGGGLEVLVIMQRQFQQSKLFDFLEEPQIQFIDRVLDLPVVPQRSVSTVRTVLKTVEISQVLTVPFLDKTADVPIVVQHRVPTIRGCVWMMRHSCSSSIRPF